jgi:hypothetical protein
VFVATPLDGSFFIFQMTKISKKSCTNILIAFFLISLLAFVISLLLPNNTPSELLKNENTATAKSPLTKTPDQTPKEKPRPDTNSPTINLIAGNLNTKLEFTLGQTLYEIFTTEKNKNLVNIKVKEYPGIGFFVEKIGNVEQGNGKYVMYSINGVEASVGVSAYVAKN